MSTQLLKLFKLGSFIYDANETIMVKQGVLANTATLETKLILKGDNFLKNVQEKKNNDSMAHQNIHDIQFGSFGGRQSDMNDGVLCNITTNSTDAIFVGANLHKSIMEKASFFKYGKTLARI